MSESRSLPPFVIPQVKEVNPPSPASKKGAKVGKPCPDCGIGILDYNGLLDLECPHCGFTEGPGGGCT